MGSREQILARVRAAVGTAAATTVPRAYHRAGTLPPAEVVELMIDRLVDYRATVHRASAENVGEVVDLALGPAGSVIAPPELDPAVVTACGGRGRTVVIDGDPDIVTAARLDGIDAVVTAAGVAIAISGTIVLDGSPDQGRRAITLVPDTHVIVLRADQIVETVPEALARLDPGRPLTLISGPSATSDIELQRVEGVHGPRHLHVVIVIR